MRIRKGSINYWLLLALEKSIDGTLRLEDFTYHSYKYMYGVPELRKNSVAEAARRLREKGFLEKTINEEGKAILKFTQLGKDFFGKEEEWDGKYRVVIWDIPEKNRRVRDLFRRKLKEWEFKSLQKSVWLSKRNITEKLKKLIAELEMEDLIVVIETDDITLENKFENK